MHPRITLYSGFAGSGKTTSQRHLVQQLVRLGTKINQSSKIGTQIRAASDILEAFGCCHSDYGANASRHSLYLELQYKARGRLFGAKLLPFMLNQEKVTDAQSHLGSYQIFYSMLKDVSSEDRRRLRLGNNIMDYPYLPYHPHMEHMNSNRDLTPAFAAMGFKPKAISQIWQLLAAILHLGRIDFVDSTQDPTLMATFPRQKQVFDLVADLLGVEEDALHQALSYKRKMISGDMCTVILDSASAKKQCDSLARGLYSLLFTYMVEAMNTQMCRRQEEQVSFIGILDMPGFDHHSPTGFENFCTNFCNEALQGFLQQKLFVEDHQTMANDGLQVMEPRLNERNQASVELLCGLDTLTDASPRGLVRFLHDATLKAGKQSGEAESSSMLPGLNRTFQSNSSFISGSTYASSFGIRHYAGDIHYNLESFFVKNQDILSPDFVSLFQTSNSPFMLQMLESNPALVTESHPRSKETIVKAQLSTMPMRQPSVRRPKQAQVQARRKGKTPNAVSTVIKQLHSTLRDICTSLDGTQLYQIIHIRPNNRMTEGLIECDPVLIRSQIEALELAAHIQSKLQAEYCVSFDHASFLQKYKILFERRGLTIDRTASNSEQCRASVGLLNWQVPRDGAIGNEYVWMSFPTWKTLEDGCIAIEKAEGRSLAFEADTDEQREFSNFVSPPSTKTYPLPGEEPNANTQLLTSYRTRAQSDASENSDASQTYPAAEPRFANYEQHYGHEPESPHSDNKTIGTPSAGSERQLMFQGFEKDDSDLKRKPTLALNRTKADESVQPPKVKTKTRRIWVAFVWLNTFWIPSFCLSLCGRMKRPDIQMAWREKVTLCLIVFWLSAIVIFFIIGLPKVICPMFDEMYNPQQIQYHTNATDFWVSIWGNVYDITKFAKNDHSGTHSGVYPSAPSYMSYLAGTDLTYQFPVDLRWACPNLVTTAVLMLPVTPYQGQYMPTHGPSPRNSDQSLPWFTDTTYYADTALPVLNKMKKGVIAILPEDFANQTGTNSWAMINGNIYDLTTYVANTNPPSGFVPDTSFKAFLDTSVVDLFTNNQGTDITKQFKQLSKQIQSDTMTCLDRAFYAGVLDERKSIKCQFGNWVLVAASVLMGGVILIKFLAALQLTSKRDPINYDKFVICQVPCYTEGEESLKKTLQSLAALQYDDKRKLLLIIADGMIVGAGNELPTPKIVLDVLGWLPTEGVEVEPVTYKALGIGGQQLNCCKVYSGLYEFEGHMVPYLVVAKVGMPNETSKPGNRGKRDSQLILMNYLNSIHTGKKMCPLELEMYHHMKNIIGVHPNLYEYILQVDADTEVMPDSLNRLVACMVADSKVIGLCGETQVANEDNSFTTMIQVYEYYISHHLAKSFESLFGSVTCLPGCFSMYRILTVSGKPLIISNNILHDYSHNDVDTLHKRNLLSLGEDRYLTTLMMKYFPGFKLKFTPDATCKTVAPDRWRVLLSQRRRWINSTIHNLGELMVLSEHCGFCFFSMRFIVFVDLLGTLILPASFVYLVYLIVVVATGLQPLPIVAVAILGAVYGLQALIFILKGAWQHIGWMIIYIIAMPFFSVFIPLYSFWHFDDFSWGNTRQVVGADGKKTVMAAEAQTRFDPSSIPLRSLEAFEAERQMRMEGNGYYTHHDGSGSVVGSSYMDDSQSMIMQSRYDHSALLGGGIQSGQYSKLDSLYGRSSSPFYDADGSKSVISGYGAEDLVHDYYRDSNAIDLSSGRNSRLPSQIPAGYIPGSAGGRPRPASPSPSQLYSEHQQQQQRPGLGPFTDSQGMLMPQPQQAGQRSSFMSQHQLQQRAPGDMIEMNQFGAPIGLGVANVGMGTPVMSSPALGVMPLVGSPQLQQQQLYNAQLEQQFYQQQQQQLMMQQSAMSTPVMMNMSAPMQTPPLQLVSHPIAMGSPMMSANQMHVMQSPAFTSMSSPHMTSATAAAVAAAAGGAGGGPTDAELVNKIHELLVGVDLMTVTKKKIRQQLEGIYGVDLTTRRDFISRTIDMELQQQNATAISASSTPPL
ncbi:chitin synthase-domain-containing protein [Dissophora ornata]|nr:chitin synthase-domain-containing protein [Dissophora ornata]